ncbi:MAG: DUF305 domain-containing protein [Rhodothermaceae bacterium]|nr:DUF305 domain-containing protein [Rhodothermaceae bacterium]
MKINEFEKFWVFLLVLGIASGCASSSQVAEQASSSSEVTVQDNSLDELEALYGQRIKEAKMRFTQADVDFMIGMIAHHAQALIMSDLAPENGASSEIRTLAARIINAQKDEIATMQKWLRDRDQAVPEVHIDGLNLMIHGVGDHGMHMHHDMPGMLTQSQLQELADSREDVYDSLFLTYMIQHHEGAVTMVHELFATDGAGQDEAAFKLASDIQVDQITEINRMKLMLSLLPEFSDP